ncbi:MAG: hypothetical protein JO170_28385, partial [Verrucomicrobia bacterium]|nr:hypothetical protein [Verrucomicrobiota bacterium]
GAPLVALQQNDSQLSVFAVDNLGTVRTVWLSSDPPSVQLPVQASPIGWAPAWAFLAAAKQSSSQLDVFFVGTDGAVWVTWQQNDGWRTDGNDGRLPKQITPSQFAEAGANLAVATRNSNQGLQLQVFVARAGGIWVTQETGDSPWTDGQDGRPGPLQVAGFPAPSSSGIAAVTRNDSHVDLFGTIPGRIKSFLELPNLLAEARALGTNILYLMDYWEGTDQGGDIPYANKGDYLPRSDLGGVDAFIEGIKQVHQLEGRVLLYVESFIIYQYSTIGQQYGQEWGGRTLDGKFWGLDVSDACYPNYKFYYTMLAPYQPWQNNLVQVAQRLVGQYGADGIMLDSCAWQMNRPMYSNNFFPFGPLFSVSAQDYSRGVLDLVTRIRSAIQETNPDAVVIGETTAGPVARYWDGGLNADLGFGNIWQPSVWPQETKDCPIAVPNTPQRLTASPVRYGIPEVRIFGNGWNLNGLHQIFAAGHGLALCSNFPGGGFMFDSAAHINQLVQIRVTYGDALIHGAQVNQPRTSDPLVAAYQYQGSQNRILTVVNTADTHSTVDISLDTSDPGGSWKNLLGNETYQTRGGVLSNVVLTSGQGSLLVLLNVPGGL